jgi:endoglucanase
MRAWKLTSCPLHGPGRGRHRLRRADTRRFGASRRWQRAHWHQAAGKVSLLKGAARGGLGVALAWMLVTSGAAAAAPALAAAAPSLRVVGNHLVDAHGRTQRLLGVDRSGSEYGCVQGGPIFDGPTTVAAVRAMVAWHINAVRVPLNEDCWLGVNGVPASLSGAAYQRAIGRYVRRLHAFGLVVILDLHWAAPARIVPMGQWPMADAGHAAAFWFSVASAFRHDHSVLFDVFNEPFIDSWRCWRDGCGVRFATGAGVVRYRTAGMQQLVSVIRLAGARQPIMLGGLNYASDVSGWRAWEPRDPSHQLVASFHTYNFSACTTRSCWQAGVGVLARSVPVVTGEFGESGCTDTYDRAFMPWADAHGVSYLGWTWNATDTNWSCSGGPALIADYNGTPTAYGVGLKDHLAALWRRRRSAS